MTVKSPEQGQGNKATWNEDSIMPGSDYRIRCGVCETVARKEEDHHHKCQSNAIQ